MVNDGTERSEEEVESSSYQEGLTNMLSKLEESLKCQLNKLQELNWHTNKNINKKLLKFGNKIERKIEQHETTIRKLDGSISRTKQKLKTE